MRFFKLLALLAAVTVMAAATAPVARTTPGSERDFLAVLAPVAGGPASGFGVVFFQQPQDTEKVVFLNVFVLGLTPNHSYYLQRATDTPVDDRCTGMNWLTLGKGLRAEAIETNTWGFGFASLFRDLAAVPTGARFDIQFRLIDAATSGVVLASRCYQFAVTP